jgi:Recombination endonuclease VII
MCMGRLYSACYKCGASKDTNKCAMCKTCHRIQNAQTAVARRAKIKELQRSTPEGRFKKRITSRRWNRCQYGNAPEYPCPGFCEACGVEIVEGGKPKANSDHDHKTNKWRGWLCTGCNTTEGQLKRVPGIERYLRGEKFKKEPEQSTYTPQG